MSLEFLQLSKLSRSSYSDVLVLKLFDHQFQQPVLNFPAVCDLLV